jgi:hypothetical protein
MIGILPPGWKKRKNKAGKIIYFHAATNTRTFDPPPDLGTIPEKSYASRPFSLNMSENKDLDTKTENLEAQVMENTKNPDSNDDEEELATPDAKIDPDVNQSEVEIATKEVETVEDLTPYFPVYICPS